MIALFAPFVAQVVATGFAPPLDRPLAYSIAETRVDGAGTLRFTVERRVTFRRRADGLIAEIDTVSATGDAGRAGRLFEAMARSMVGRRVVLHIDDAGKVRDVENLDAQWDAQLTALSSTLASRSPSRAAAFAAMVAPLRTVSRATKVALVAEALTPIVAVGDIMPGTARTITLPARGLNGATALLPGTEAVTAAGDGMLVFERRAAGRISDAPTSVVQRRRIDPRTRLTVETVAVTTVDAPDNGRLVVTRTTRLSP